MYWEVSTIYLDSYSMGYTTTQEISSNLVTARNWGLYMTLSRDVLPSFISLHPRVSLHPLFALSRLRFTSSLLYSYLTYSRTRYDYRRISRLAQSEVGLAARHPRAFPHTRRAQRN
jgi:hypothetical protein